MKKRTVVLRRLLMGVSTAVLATAGVALAFNPQPEPPAFGMASLPWARPRS